MKKSFAAVLTLLACTLLLWSAPLTAQQTSLKEKPNKEKSDVKIDTRLFPLEDVRAGQKGIARTVFSGVEPQEFGVEVLGVIPGFPAPRQSAIIARLTGANVERTGVFAGMSGSPVFIDGRLVGAIAFAFPFAKEPIAGITPIKQMIEIFERGQAPGTELPAPPQPRPVSLGKLMEGEWQVNLPKSGLLAAPFLAPVAANSPLAGLLGQQLAPIATPIVFNGISSETLALFGPQLQASNLLPVAGLGGAAAITPLARATEQTLAPGASVSVQLVRGDYSIAAAGTVTFRDGERIYAFGHPFLGLGVADMPMSEASVVAVIPNTFNSFKLSVPGQMVGAISQDRSTGIFGQLGRAPRMIPVSINLRTSRERTERYTFEVANDKFLTPLLLNLSIYNAIASSERSLGDATISVRGQIRIANQTPVRIDHRFSTMNAAMLASKSVAAPVAALLMSGFDDVEVNGITLEVASSDVVSTGALERITLDRTEVGRGEKIEVQAYIRNASGKQFVERIPIEIPSDVPLGQLLLFVGDGSALQQTTTMQSFVPKDLGQLVTVINKIKKTDRLYVKLFRVTPGAVIGTDEMPNLPPSVLATLNSDRAAGGYTPMALSPIFEKELPPADFVVDGQQLLTINVVR